MCSSLIGDFGELQLNSMIQMRENYNQGAYALFSLALCIIIVITYFLLISYMAYILNRRPAISSSKLPPNDGKRTDLHEKANPQILRRKVGRTIKVGKIQPPVLQEHSVKEPRAEVPSQIQIISEDFRTKNRFTRNFMLVMMGNNFLLILLVFLLQNYGLVQSIVYTIITVIYVGLVICQRPLKSKVQTGILLMNQGCKIIMGVIAIIFAVNDFTQMLSQSVFDTLGVVLIVLILAVIVISVLISVVILIASIYKAISKCIKRTRVPLSNKGNIRKTNNSINEKTAHNQGSFIFTSNDAGQSHVNKRGFSYPRKDTHEFREHTSMDSLFSERNRNAQMSAGQQKIRRPEISRKITLASSSMQKRTSRANDLNAREDSSSNHLLREIEQTVRRFNAREKSIGKGVTRAGLPSNKLFRSNGDKSSEDLLTYYSRYKNVRKPIRRNRFDEFKPM